MASLFVDHKLFLLLGNMFGSCDLKSREILSKKDANSWIERALLYIFDANLFELVVRSLKGWKRGVGEETIRSLLTEIIVKSKSRIGNESCIVEEDQILVRTTVGESVVRVITLNRCPVFFGDSESPSIAIQFMMKVRAIMKQQLMMSCAQMSLIATESECETFSSSVFELVVLPSINAESNGIQLCVRSDVSAMLMRGNALWARGTHLVGVVNSTDGLPLDEMAEALRVRSRERSTKGIICVPNVSIPFAVGVVLPEFLQVAGDALTTISNSLKDSQPKSLSHIVPFSLWGQAAKPEYFSQGEPVAMRVTHVAFDGLWKFYYDGFVAGSQKEGISTEKDLVPSGFSPSGVRESDGFSALSVLKVKGDELGSDDSTSSEEDEMEDCEVVVPQTPDEIGMFAFCEAVRQIPVSAYPMPIPTFIAQYMQKNFPRLPLVGDEKKDEAAISDELPLMEETKKLSKKEEYELKKKEKQAAKGDKKKKTDITNDTAGNIGFDWKQTSLKKPLAFVKDACERIGVLVVEKEKDIKLQKGGKVSQSKLLKDHRVRYGPFLSLYHYPAIQIEELLEEQKRLESGDEGGFSGAHSVVTSVQTRYALSKGVPLDIRQHVSTFSSTMQSNDDDEEVETNFSADLLAAQDSRFKLGCFPSYVIAAGVRDYLKKNNLIVQVSSDTFSSSSSSAKAATPQLQSLPSLPNNDTPVPTSNVPAWQQVMSRREASMEPEVTPQAPPPRESLSLSQVPAVKINDSIRTLVQGRVPQHLLGNGGEYIEIGVLCSLFNAPNEAPGQAKRDGPKGVTLGKGLQLLIPANCISLGMRTANGGVDASGGRRVMLQGKLPHVHVHSCFVNNRNMILVSGLLAFGLSLSTIARSWRKKLACAVSVQVPTGAVENLGQRRNIRRERIRNKIDSKVSAFSEGNIPDPFIQVSGQVNVEKMLAELGIPEHVIKVHNTNKHKKK